MQRNHHNPFLPIDQLPNVQKIEDTNAELQDMINKFADANKDTQKRVDDLSKKAIESVNSFLNDVFDSLSAGADGYIMKGADKNQLIFTYIYFSHI